MGRKPRKEIRFWKAAPKFGVRYIATSSFSISSSRSFSPIPPAPLSPSSSSTDYPLPSPRRRPLTHTIVPQWPQRSHPRAWSAPTSLARCGIQALHPRSTTPCTRTLFLWSLTRPIPSSDPSIVTSSIRCSARWSSPLFAPFSASNFPRTALLQIRPHPLPAQEGA